MNRDTVLADLQARGLAGFCLFQDPRGKQNVIVLTHGRGGFQTWIQDERGRAMDQSVRVFPDEESALIDFAHRVELWNRVTGVRTP